MFQLLKLFIAKGTFKRMWKNTIVQLRWIYKMLMHLSALIVAVIVFSYKAFKKCVMYVEKKFCTK